MWRVHARALLTVCLLVAAVGATALTVGANHSDEVTVDGTVTGTDGSPAGDAVVLIGQDATLTTHSPAELLAIAEDDPNDPTGVPVADDGRFSTTLDSRRAEAAVAVSEDETSDLVYLHSENATLDIRLYDHRPQTVHAHLGSVAHDERRAQLFVNLGNSGETTISNLSVTLGELPDGWSVAEARTDGQYHATNRTLAWSSVGPSEEVDTTVVLSVPGDASAGTYTVSLSADSDTHRVDVSDETVEVLPEKTAGPTETVLPGDGEETAASTSATPTSPTATSASGPGMGLAVTLAALAGAAGLLIRRP